MKPSEIKQGVTYLCLNGTYRRIIFFWDGDRNGNIDVAYAQWTRNAQGRMIRATWIGGNCTLKHFARIAVCKAPPYRSRKKCKNKK
jgi:hypothetical protein